MNIRTQRILLWSVGGVQGLAALATGLYFARTTNLAPKVESQPIRSSKANTSETAALRDHHAEPTIEELRAAAAVNLRRPFTDAPNAPLPAAQAIAVEAPSAATINVRLAGTIIEPNHNRAILIGPDGKSELKSVGERSGDAQVVEIGPDTCVVDYADRRVTLKIERKGTGG